jgi:hypothetical protein
MVNDAAGAHNLRGIAGEPPPEPMSIRLDVAGGKYLAANVGSKSNRSIASSA